MWRETLVRSLQASSPRAMQHSPPTPPKHSRQPRACRKLCACCNRCSATQMETAAFGVHTRIVERLTRPSRCSPHRRTPMADMTLEQVANELRITARRGASLAPQTCHYLADAIDAAIKQREQDASNPLKGWIFDKVNIGRGDERYICTPDGSNATAVRNESTSNHRERLLWL